MLINLMEGVEDIPEVVLTEGLPWNWHSFPDFLDALAARPYDVDVATQVPHAALRVYVMGQRGADREPATEQDRRRMAELAAEGMRAGALGFSTSRTLNHRAADGRHIPTLRAEEAELTAIAHAMRDAGTGWLQIVSDFEDQETRSPCCAAGEGSGRPITITLLQSDARPDGWRGLMARSTRPTPRGCASPPRSAPARPACCWASSSRRTRSWAGRATSAIAHLPFAERLAKLRQPEFRARILAEAFEGRRRCRRVERWDRMFPLGDPPDYEPTAEHSIAARAAREGRPPEEVAYDLLLESDGKRILYRPVTNYAGGNLEWCAR